MSSVWFLIVLATHYGITSGTLEGKSVHNRQISLAGCSGTKQDIFFVMDSSGSVGMDNFIKMKTFVKGIINNLDIGQDLTRVGVITYSRYPSIRLHLSDFYTKTEIDNAVDQIPYIAGITETDLALQLLQQEGLREARPDVPQVAIVITDGQSFHPNRTNSAATSLKASGSTVFSIGIGDEVNLSELQTISTDPDQNYVFQVTNFQSLLNITGTLTDRTCNVTQPLLTVQPSVMTTLQATLPTIVINPTVHVQRECNKTVANLIFVLDSSGSLGPNNFNSIKQFVINIVSTLDIGTSYTHVGVITFSSYPTERIPLNAYSDTQSLLSAISQIPYYPGNTETDKALDLLRLEGFRNARKGAPNIAIVVTDGLSTNPSLTNISAKLVKDAGITVFAIGIGDSISVSELNIISSEPNSYYVFNVSDYSELHNIENSLAITTCDVPNRLTTPVPEPTIKTTVGPTNPSTTPVTCSSKVVDVVFVIDDSGSVGSADFARIKNFVKQTINLFDVGTTFTRVGVITYSSTAQLVFGLDTYSNNADLINAVDNIPYSSGGTNTGAALELLRKSGFLNERGNVPNIAILITDGRSKDYDATRQQAYLVKQGGNTLITIGIGNDTDRNELETIASKDPITGQSLVYNVGNYNDLQSLDTVIATLACGVRIRTTDGPVTTKVSVTPAKLSCFNAIDNCDAYGQDICSDYEPWARAHCNWYCGFCTGGPSTTPAPCKNKIKNCHEYGTYICTEVSLIRWTKSNCPEYCGLCGGRPQPSAVTPARQSTSKPDSVCRNKVNNCDEYGGKDMCNVPAYRAWAKENCNQYCNFCSVYRTFPGVTLSKNVTCPDVLLPKECTMLDIGGSCCPVPRCPDGYVIMARHQRQV